MSLTERESKDGFELTKKNKVFIGIFAVIILGLMIYNFVSGKSSSFPSGNLSNTQGATKFEKDDTTLPYFYQFEDIPYVIGTPSKGITKVEGGFAYTFNGMGLVIAEVSNARTMLAYSTDMYSSLYAVQNPPDIKEVSAEDGFINGYAASYAVYEARLPELDKTVYELMYLLKVDKESVVIAATSESNKKDELTIARDFLAQMINTLAYYSDSNTEQTPDVIGETETVDVSKQTSQDDATVIKQAVLTAAQDYSQMCLIFSYVNVSNEPEECYVLDKKGKKHNASFIHPGEYGFVISNVTEGDDFTVCIKSKELDGAMFSQQEYSDYQREQEGYREGNLHVEEGMEEAVEPSIESTETSDVEGIEDLVKNIEDDDLATQITQFDRK